MRNAIIALAVVVGVLAGFYGGYKVGHSNVVAASTSSNSGGSRTASNGGGFTGRGGLNGGTLCPSPGATPATGSQALARGTVTNLTATSMTVATAQCSITITFGPTTTVQKQVTGSVSDLSNNETVTVTGTRAADGSITAVTIQVTPAGGFTRPGAGASPSPGGGG